MSIDVADLAPSALWGNHTIGVVLTHLVGSGGGTGGGSPNGNQLFDHSVVFYSVRTNIPSSVTAVPNLWPSSVPLSANGVAVDSILSHFPSFQSFKSDQSDPHPGFLRPGGSRDCVADGHPSNIRPLPVEGAYF